MNHDFVPLTRSINSVAGSFNFIYASELQNTNVIQEPVPVPIVETKGLNNNTVKLIDFSLNEEKSFLEKAMSFIIDEIKRIDPENLDRYNAYLESNPNNIYFTINTIESASIEKISSLSFSIGIYNDSDYGRKAVLNLNGLYVNKKFENTGSRILEIMQTAIRSLVGLEQLSAGFIELYSVETAVLFYIKNGFLVKDLFTKNHPQSKAQSTHKMLHFALKENNIEIMKRYAKVNQENFIDFVEQILNDTKYGKFFRAYFDNLEDPMTGEEGAMKSRFIASMFNTDMIWTYFRDPAAVKIILKPLTF